MLARAAAGRKLRRTPTQAAHRLALPWLCPRQTRWTCSTSSIDTNTHDARRQRPLASQSTRPLALHSTRPLAPDSTRPLASDSTWLRRQSRLLATAADVQATPSSSSSSPPFDGFMQAWAPNTQASELARLPQWDTSSPLIVRDSNTAVPNGFRSHQGFGADPVELHQNLHACLHVGRIDRAAIIIDRLASLYDPSAPEVLDAHNNFLQAMFELVQSDPQPDSFTKIEQWYETHMAQNGIAPNVQTFVTLLRAAINFLDGDVQEKTVRRFLATADQLTPGLVDDINSSPDFTDEEWDTLIRLQPESYNEPPPIEEVQDLHVNTPTGHKNLVEHGLYTTQHIKPVAQKGMGLDSLKQALAIFQTSKDIPYPHDMEGTQEEKDQAYAYARQLRLEEDALGAAVDRWKHEDAKLQELGIHGVLNSKSIQALMYNWYTALVPLFEKQIEHSKTMENPRDDAFAYAAWLQRCKPESLAAITISRVLQGCVRGKGIEEANLKISAMTIAIGSDIQDYLNTDTQARRDAFLKKQRKETRRHLVDQLSKNKTPFDTPEVTTADASMSMFVKTDIPLSVRTKLGALALELLLQSATITVTAVDPKTGNQLSSTQAAFHHHIGYHQGKKVGYVAPHHEITAKLRKNSVHGVQTVRLPMLVQPKPWTGFDSGGYYTTPEHVVRQKSSDTAQKAYAQTAIENGDMKKVLAALDMLGRVPWQINSPVLEVMTKVWNSGVGLAGIVPEEYDAKPPPEPPADATYQERAKWGKKLQEYENMKSGLHSQRCFQNFQLETAMAFANEGKIFFPHSVDFRGRAYPIPPILNHIGSDVARGLLKFANGKELGTVGLKWLKVHLANLYGFDKASLREREQFAMDHIDDIRDSANNPLDGNRWWVNAEDPWQCLACCMELNSALNLPDPTTFVSQLPVHQDGTCNGLQHYAALGGDEAGARQVNLEPSDRPQDIYTGVADMVKEMVIKDAAEGHPCAKFINGHITRKVVKRTVMTNVYGVTFMGATAQVHDELKNIFPDFKDDSAVKSLHNVSLYIAYKIFEALGKIFNGAQEIQYWLGECGDRITTSITAEQIKRIQGRYEGKDPVFDSKFKAPKGKVSAALINKLNKSMEVFKTSIIWTTPLKMPIVQPYRKSGTQKIKTKIQDITVSKRTHADEVDRRKQLQAFPPNFIHSLDATHMSLSALKCSEMGLDFAAVHDSFWTHASDIPNLNVILRDAFVRMHSEDIIGRLTAEFSARYAGAMYRVNLLCSSKVGHEISKWRFHHRRAQGIAKAGRHGSAPFEEVAMEAQRQELLASEDPELRKKGEEMVTPTSIWLANQDPLAIASYRLHLIGETKTTTKDSKTFSEVKNKILGAEAEAVEAEAAESDVAESAQQDTEELGSESGAKIRSPSATMSDKATVQAWIPLTFPPVPKKGGWDVSRLRESEYFFS